MIISPTGLGMRNDNKGAGFFGAPRDGRKHAGYDFLCVPWQNVFCPIDDAQIVRIARPYETFDYSGAIIERVLRAFGIFFSNFYLACAGRSGRKKRNYQAAMGP